MSLYEVWQAAASSPFEPSVGKDSQLYVGFILLLIGTALSLLDARAILMPFAGLFLTVLFGLSMSRSSSPSLSLLTPSDRSPIAIPAFGIPASLAFGSVPFEGFCGTY